MPRSIDAGVLTIACEEWGPANGAAAILLHGFPYDPRAFDAVAPILADDGMRVIVPYLRGFGATRFRDPATPRSGEQAALADDLRALMDALAIPRALLVGFDWGGRAAQVTSILWPDRVSALVAIGGYLVQDPVAALAPLPPAIEQRVWHQYYLASARGRAALEADSDGLCRHFWRTWSPGWSFDDATFARSAASFASPDFVDVVTHSYAHRIGAAAGDPAYAHLQTRLAGRPAITIPTILLRGGDAPLAGGGTDRFSALLDDRTVPGAGHNPAQETPAAVVQAVRDGVAAIR